MHNFDDENSFEATPVFGKNAVVQLLKSDKGTDTVFIQEGMNKAQASYYTALAKEVGATVKHVHTAKLNKLCKSENHQGVAAFGAQIEYCAIDDILHVAAQKNEEPFIIIADGIEDPHNLGAIIRSAFLCGAHGIIIPKRGGASITPVVIKSSAGAALNFNIAKVANIGESVRRLKKQGVFVYCATAGRQSAFSQNLKGAIALVLGSEGSGVSPLVQKLCDSALSLPMANEGFGVDSFNVSVAAGILMYEISRQRVTDSATR